MTEETEELVAELMSNIGGRLESLMDDVRKMLKTYPELRRALSMIAWFGVADQRLIQCVAGRKQYIAKALEEVKNAAV